MTKTGRIILLSKSAVCDSKKSNYQTARGLWIIKDALEGLRQFLATEGPLKMIKNVFYFTLKALFVLKISNFLS